ncbi:dgt2, partial [Drosophila busckii]
MDINDPSATILVTETQELLEARDAELHKVRKLKLILEVIPQLSLGSAESPEIKRALKLLSVADFIRLKGDKGYLLDLQDSSSGNCPTISYTDSKAVRQQLSAKLRETLLPIAELGDKIRNELPDALTNAEAQLSTQQSKIIKLHEEHSECLSELASLRSRKCELMKAAAELKMGPNLVNELKLAQAQSQLLHTKADLMRAYGINEIFSRSEHSLKAYKEVEKHIDELLSCKQ